MPFSLRLDPDTEARIRRLAHATGKSKSAVVREAMAQYGAEPEAQHPDTPSALDRLRSYVGVVGTGGADLSTDTHEKFRASLARKRRARRTR